MWTTWTASTFALLAVCLSPLVCNPVGTLLVSVVMELILFAAIRRNHGHSNPRCYLIPFITTRILLWTTVSLGIILIMHRTGHIRSFFDADTLNADAPFIPSLAVGTAATILSGIAFAMGLRLPFCVNCHMRHGYPSERGFLGKIYSQEGQFQVRILFWLSGGYTATAWIYYLLRYINVNFNSADRFFFFWLESGLFILAAVYLGIRYLGLWHYYMMDVAGSEVRHGPTTYVRYLIINNDNRMFVVPPSANPDRLYSLESTKTDTPAALYLSRRGYVSDSDAREMLIKLIPELKSPKVRGAYRSISANSDSNIFHFIVNIDTNDAAALQSRYSDGNWLTMFQLSKLREQHKLNPLLSSELHRLYTIGMAWKTYDRQGRRLYSIRNYRPNFRLSDVIDWKVDFNDTHWFYVARNNQDKSLYTLKSWWRRNINGIR